MPAARDKTEYGLAGVKRDATFHLRVLRCRFRPRSIPSRNYKKKKREKETVRGLISHEVPQDREQVGEPLEEMLKECVKGELISPR